MTAVVVLESEVGSMLQFSAEMNPGLSRYAIPVDTACVFNIITIDNELYMYRLTITNKSVLYNMIVDTDTN